MRYVGGKTRIAKPLAELIRTAREDRSTYVEPFLGGASVFSVVAPAFPRTVAADVVPDLVLMWQAARDGWTPPSDLSEAEYAALRHAEPSALRGFAGFGCSFGGKWFGGYARGAGRNFPDEASRRVVARAAGLAGSLICLADYRDLDQLIDAGAVVYCDPPYAGTTGYAAASPWDADTFWATAADWATRGAAVLVSEYAAPDGWEVVWERQHRQSLQGGTAPRPATTERVFALPHTAAAIRKATP